MTNKPIFEKTYKVYINHTDAGGIVYHANHLIFLEHCRRDWLAGLGFDGYFFKLEKTRQDPDGNHANRQNHGQDGVLHFVVSQAQINYIAPLLVDDELTVTVEKFILKPASLILHQNIYRPDSSKAASTSVITLACVKNDGQKIRLHRLPKVFIQALENAI